MKKKNLEVWHKIAECRMSIAKLARITNTPRTMFNSALCHIEFAPEEKQKLIDAIEKYERGEEDVENNINKKVRWNVLWT